jgi:hypothetical protein
MRVVKIKIPPKLDTVQWYTVGVGSWILAKSHYFWVSYISSLQFPLAGLRRKIKSGIKGGREGEIFFKRNRNKVVVVFSRVGDDMVG